MTQAIAKIIAESKVGHDDAIFAPLVIRLAQYFNSEFEGFDKKAFYEACDFRVSR